MVVKSAFIMLLFGAFGIFVLMQYGHSPLLAAVTSNHAEIAILLIEHGAEIETEDPVMISI